MLKTSETASLRRTRKHLSPTGNAMSFADAKIAICSIQLPGALGNKSRSGRGWRMIERVIYTEEAGDEVAESYTWYESRGAASDPSPRREPLG